MLGTMFKFETKLLGRSKGVLIALLLFTSIGFYALLQGKVIYTFQQISIAKTNKYVAKNDSTLKIIFDTLNTSASAKRTDSEVEAPFVLEWKLQDAQAKTISPLSILSIGQNDIYAPILSKHFNRPIFQNEYTEFKNPEQLLAGNLDTAFFILFLFPLLLLALTYNVQSADKENGIFPLLQAQAKSIKTVINQRLFIRWLIALLPLVVLCLASVIILFSLPNFSIVDFLLWWVVAILYTLFWLAIVALVQRFNFNSLVNAITLAGIWVIFLIAIPGIINTWLNYKYPVSNKLEITEYRDFDFKAWNKPIEEHRRIINSQFPDIKLEDKKIDEGDVIAFGYILQVLDKEKELHTGFIKKTELQAQTEINGFWINPIGGVMRSFTTLANTTLQQQQAFEKAIITHRESKAKYLFVNQLTQPHFTKEDYQNMPVFIMPAADDNWAKYLLPLVVFVVLLMVSLMATKTIASSH
jgi:ABC-2 type transport system permease protein